MGTGKTHVGDHGFCGIVGSDTVKSRIYDGMDVGVEVAGLG